MNLLPCGLVYLACAAATTTGSVSSGLQFMLLFGPGTVPMMLGLGVTGRLLHVQLQGRVQRVSPVALAVMGVLLILRGMSPGIPYLSPDLSGGGGGWSCCH